MVARLKSSTVKNPDACRPLLPVNWNSPEATAPVSAFALLESGYTITLKVLLTTNAGSTGLRCCARPPIESVICPVTLRSTPTARESMSVSGVTAEITGPFMFAAPAPITRPYAYGGPSTAAGYEAFMMAKLGGGLHGGTLDTCPLK